MTHDSQSLYTITNPPADAAESAQRVYDAGMTTVQLTLQLRDAVEAIKGFQPQHASASLPELQAQKARIEEALLNSKVAHAAEVERAQLVRAMLDFQTAQLSAAKGSL